MVCTQPLMEFLGSQTGYGFSLVRLRAGKMSILTRLMGYATIKFLPLFLLWVHVFLWEHGRKMEGDTKVCNI